MSFFANPAVAGFFLGAGLIIAIGAQNAFILRQGLLRRHVFVLCLICSLSDALLIAAGVAGLGTLVARSDTLLPIVTVAGAGFLLAYGAIAFRRVLRPKALEARQGDGSDLMAAIMACLAFTFLNPHVYLDTVVLVGSYSARYDVDDRRWFAAGAMAASFAWFFALGYGARFLAPLFARPSAWRILDTVIGIVMWALAASLLAGMR
ncbi:LysE/ArgO family amino acid transporter [Pararhizobium haloflavum]|uniref:LysE/ArgO family amino acid transporter n=1 Tax=Pararhizobium haloflavum TaxID=2037914 RepID=UPI000C17701F|nr:LysE/ArgO family amino acid transporter [Pararhizobium haloflavum]